ncbi:DnaJ domain-containing protein [uncultured Cohaesibacter sp.]|uniref:DnaJ domain-containing protein n=1 Tax=uncultured Cohaesibacter sp. TaxID=1002546 RepID=UPI0029314C73|nr:DnaJ domain-containing protein [uncultured Cohaesibacter sp.]
MIYFLAGFLLFAGLIFLLRWAAYANPQDLAMLAYRVAGLLLLLGAGFLVARRQWMFAVPVMVMAWTLLRRKASRAGADRDGGRGSTVRTAALEMTLDHDTGIIIGQVLAGQFEGRELDSLSEADLCRLWQEVESDRESRDLLEAYLDGRRADWRESFNIDPTAREGGTTNSGPMSQEEAYQVLGLAAGASEAEIVHAHRRLMKRVHPDHGGSTFLAAKINAAKSVLLRNHD